MRRPRARRESPPSWGSRAARRGRSCRLSGRYAGSRAARAAPAGDRPVSGRRRSPCRDRTSRLSLRCSSIPWDFEEQALCDSIEAGRLFPVGEKREQRRVGFVGVRPGEAVRSALDRDKATAFDQVMRPQDVSSRLRCVQESLRAKIPPTAW